MLSRVSRDGEESGFTLVEVLVVAILLTVVSALVSGVIVKTIRSSRQTQARTAAVANLRTTLDRVSRDFRAADPLRTATPTVASMDVYRASGGCLRETYTLNVSAQTVTQTEASCATPSTAIRTSLIAQLESTTSLFTYFGASSDSALSGTIDPATVARVAISAAIQPPENRGAVTVTTTTELRNH